LLFVEITGGTADAELIPPGDRIPAGSSLLGTLTGKAENIAIKTEEALNRILSITEEGNLQNLRLALQNLEAATRSARNVLESLDGVSVRVAPLMTELSDAATSMHTAGIAVSSVAGDARKVTSNLQAMTAPDGALTVAVGQLGRTLQTADAVLGGENAAQTAKDARNALRSFTETMNSLSTMMGGSARDVQEISSSLRDAAEYLEEFARAIRENPSLLIRQTEED
jgi:ABC-type transporter Mla subunit MlaD